MQAKVMRAAILTHEPAPVGLRLKTRTRNLEPYIWIAPALLVFGVFTLLPVAAGLWLSLTGWNGTARPFSIALPTTRRPCTTAPIGRQSFTTSSTPWARWRVRFCLDLGWRWR
jgi:ABC-type sugar transport system permease subunit